MSCSESVCIVISAKHLSGFMETHHRSFDHSPHEKIIATRQIFCFGPFVFGVLPSKNHVGFQVNKFEGRIFFPLMISSSADTHVKLLMIGESNVGKSSLLRRLVDDSFNPSFVATIGIDFRICAVQVRGVPLRLQIWDTAGQEQFRSITAAFYRGAMGVALAYDSTNLRSFQALPSWMEMIRTRACANVSIILASTKNDKSEERVVSSEQGRSFASEHGIMFVETSAKDNINVGSCFDMLASQVLDRFFPQLLSDEGMTDVVDLKKTSRDEKCCN